MEYSTFNRYLHECVSIYKEMLISDFELYPEYMQLASKLCSNGKLDLVEYVKNLEIEDLSHWKYKGNTGSVTV